MTIPAENELHPVKPGRNAHEGSAGTNQTSLACLATYAPSAMLLCGHMYAQLGALDRRIQNLEERLGRLGTIIEQQQHRHDQHVAILAACQRDTANALNHELEKYALHPAVEALVSLAEELSHLKDGAGPYLAGEADSDNGSKLRAEIDISCTVAREKLANLNVQMIAPKEGKAFDVKAHAICGYAETTDKALHGQISKLLTPGIIYRGKVLRQARITVFRMKEPEHRKS